MSLFASANSSLAETAKHTALKETNLAVVENLSNNSLPIFIENGQVCYTSYLRLLVDTYTSPTTGQVVDVYRVYTITTCIPMNASTSIGGN